MIKGKVCRAVAVTILSTSAFSVVAQDGGGAMVMSLEQCLSYARENSIALQQAQLEVADYMIDESSAKSTFLPSVSGSVGQSVNNTPFSDSDPNTEYTGSYGVDMSMTLYSGGENSLTLKKSKVSTQIALLGVSEQESVLDISITQLYVEILYAMEQITVCESSIALAQKNIERGRALLEVGSLNEADFAQLISAEATERYNLVVAQTSLSNSYVQLKHLLEISDNTTLVVTPVELSDSEMMVGTIPSVETVYATAMEIRPEIQSSALSVESALIGERIARSGYLPTLSLSAGIGVSHVSGSDYTFSDQIKSNYSNSVGLSLSVPIFSKFQNKNAVAKSKNATKSATLTYTQSSKTLYQTIETLHNNAANAYAMYQVSEAKLAALDRSLELVTEQYELGLKNIIELLTEQDDYRQSSQEYLESKYVMMLNRALLDYYQTGIIKL